MKKSYTKIFIHYIWATKNRERVLTKEILKRLMSHIREYCRQKGIFVVEMGGYLEHLHLLVDLSPAKSVAETINLVKGESSHWINSSDLLPGKFAWQVRYSAFSVSASQKERVAEYIRNQENHHHKKSFQEELTAFYQKHGMDIREMP